MPNGRCSVGSGGTSSGAVTDDEEDANLPVTARRANERVKGGSIEARVVMPVTL